MTTSTNRRNATLAGTTAALLAALSITTLAGCTFETHNTSVNGSQDTRPVPKTGNTITDEQMMSRLESLEGEWESQDADGNWNTAAVFSVSSNGSVVREIMFPGQPHEMTNLYHLDGTNAVVTHYCAIGNQPRMVAKGITKTEDGPAFDYEFDSVSNLRPDHTHVMGSLRLVFIDDDHIRQDWTSMATDKTAEGEADSTMSFNLRRKH